MATTQSHPWFPGNQCTANFACEHCQGVIQHERWCLMQNPNVMSAWEAVLDPANLSLHDLLILHALGVSWVDSRLANSRTQVVIR